MRNNVFLEMYENENPPPKKKWENSDIFHIEFFVKVKRHSVFDIFPSHVGLANEMMVLISDFILAEGLFFFYIVF